MRLRTRLALSFVAVGLAAVLTITILVNLFLEVSFREYSMKKQEERNREVLSLVASQYSGEGGWKVGVIQDIGVNVLEEGLILTLTDASGRVVWDALQYNSGICQSMIEQMTRRMAARYPSLDGGLTHTGYPVQSGDRRVGTLQIGTYGPFYFSDTEFFFIDALNRLLVWVAAGTLVLSLGVGVLVARPLSAPIAGVIASTRRIAAGEYTARVATRSRTWEVQQLVGSVNHLAETLGEQEDLRRRLVADVAHELRTPLATVQGHLEAMIDGVWAPTPERLSSCHEEMLRLTHLVQDLATLARYEAGALVLSLEPLDILAVARGAVRLHEEPFRKAGLTLACSGEPAVAPGDRDKLTQVLVNLLDNALAYTPQGGRVEVRVKDAASLVQLVVEDTGRGIPAGELPHIFERFYRVDGSRSRATGGAGIGLTIVREIVRAHGGTIEAHSRVGVGSEFVVCLPKAPVRGTKAPARGPKDPSQPVGHG